jgi:hypothetical protein
MIVRVRDREQPLAAKFNDVLELGGRHIYMAKSLAYLQENRQYILCWSIIMTIMTHRCTMKNVSARKEAHNVKLEFFNESLKP